MSGEEAAKRKLGLEACGRAVRYEFFRRLAGENGVIATAHTLSDLAETVLLHLTRGAALQGAVRDSAGAGEHRQASDRLQPAGNRGLLPGA